MPDPQEVLIAKATDRLTVKEILQVLTITEIEPANRGHNAPTPLLLGNALDQVPKGSRCRPLCAQRQEHRSRETRVLCQASLLAPLSAPCRGQALHGAVQGYWRQNGRPRGRPHPVLLL